MTVLIVNEDNSREIYEGVRNADMFKFKNGRKLISLEFISKEQTNKCVNVSRETLVVIM